MDTKIVKQVWNYWFTSKEDQNDPFGIKISFDKFGIQEEGGWKIEYCWPKNRSSYGKGADIVENMIPLANKSAHEFHNHFSGVVNKKKFITFLFKKVEAGSIGIVGLPDDQKFLIPANFK